MRRLGLTLILGLLGASCGSRSDGGSTSTTGSDSGSSESCPVGSEGCPCTPGGACDPGLLCLSNICVDAGGGTSTSSSDGGGTGSGTGGTSDDGGATSSSGTGTGSSGTSSTGTGTSDTTGTTSSSGTTGTTTSHTTTSGTWPEPPCVNGVRVASHQKISDTEGSFAGVLDDFDHFGAGVGAPGDIDGDGVIDILASAHDDDDGGNNRGAVWALFLNADGTVKSHQKISSTEGGFTGTLDNGDVFGHLPASLGDLDGDGVPDAAAGAYGDDSDGSGAIWVLLLNANGTVKSHQKIRDGVGGFTGPIAGWDVFGVAAAGIGDLDGDGRTELAVGAYLDDGGGSDRGAVWILFLNADGTVKASQEITDNAGGFTGVLDDEDRLGRGVGAPGDIDGDGVVDLVVGAPHDDDGGSDKGAVWVLFLNTDGTVKSHQKISETEGGFAGPLEPGDNSWRGFGTGVAGLGDVDEDGVPDIAVGDPIMDEGGTEHGALWVLLLNDDGTVRVQSKISDATGGFSGTIDEGECFGQSIVSLGDLDGNGVTDIAVGAGADGDGGTERGALWILFLGCA